jgi:hypothetical protein
MDGITGGKKPAGGYLEIRYFVFREDRASPVSTGEPIENKYYSVSIFSSNRPLLDQKSGRGICYILVLRIFYIY